MDTPDQVEAFAAVLRGAFDVVEESGEYANRGASRMVRRYVDLRLRPGTGTGTGTGTGGDGELRKVLLSLAEHAASSVVSGNRWRVVMTDSESFDGISLVCTDPMHPTEIDGYPDDGMFVRECCERYVIETYDDRLAAFLVAALNEAPTLLAVAERLGARP
ncbi:MAG: hypothetical protein ACJ786_29310 [Catenulispora sp.]